MSQKTGYQSETGSVYNEGKERKKRILTSLGRERGIWDYMRENGYELVEFINRYITIDKFIRDNLSKSDDAGVLSKKLEEHKRLLNDILEESRVIKTDNRSLDSRISVLDSRFDGIKMDNVERTLEDKFKIFEMSLGNIMKEMEALKRDDFKREMEGCLKDMEDEFSKKISTRVKFDLLENGANDQIVSEVSKIIERYVGEIDRKDRRTTNNIIKNVDTRVNHVMSNVDKTYKELLALGDLFKNAKRKGNASENAFFKNLCSGFPDYDVVNVTKKSKMGDFLIKRENCPTILIDVKDFKNNVNKNEIDKFKRDVFFNDCCGILVSISSGICNKKDFDLEVNNTNIMMYIHTNGYEMTKIKHAVGVIYKVYNLVREKKDFQLKLNKVEYEDICNGYKTFVSKYKGIIENLKTTAQNIQNNIDKMERLKMKEIEHFVNQTLDELNKEKSTRGKVYKCSECNSDFVSKYSWQRHMKNFHVEKVINIGAFKCETCNKEYRTKGRFDNHIKKVHTRIEETNNTEKSDSNSNSNFDSDSDSDSDSESNLNPNLNQDYDSDTFDDDFVSNDDYINSIMSENKNSNKKIIDDVYDDKPMVQIINDTRRTIKNQAEKELVDSDCEYDDE